MRRYFAYWRNLNYKVKIRVFKRPQLKKDKRYQYFLNKRYLLRNKRNYLRLQAYRGIILERQQLFYKYNYYLNLKKEKKKIKDFVKRQLYLKVIKKLLKKELKRRKKLVKSKNYMYVYNLNKGIVKKKMIVPLYKKVIKRKIVNYSVNKKKLINLFKKEKNTSGKQYIKLLKKSRIGEANKLSIKHSLDTVVKNFIKKNKYTSTIQIDNSNELYNRLYYFKTFKAIFEKKKYKLALISVKKKYLLKKKKKISLSLYNKYKYWQKNTAQFSNRKLLKNKFNYYQNNYYQNKFYYKRKRRYKSKFKFKYKFKYKRLFKKFWKKRKKYYKKYVKKLVKMRIKLKNRFLMYKVQKKKAYLLTDKLFKNVKHIINYNKKINTLKNKLILGSTVNIIKFRMKMHNFSFNLVKKCDEELLDNFNKNYMSNFVKIFINKYQEIMLKKKKNNNYIINILKLKLIREQQSLLLNNNKIMDIKKKLSFKHLIKNKYIYLHNKGQYKAIKKTKDMKKKYVTHRIKQNFLTRLIKMKLKQQLVTYKLLSYKRYILKQKNKQRYNFISHSFIKQFNVLKRQRFVYRYKYSNGFLFKKVYRLQYIKRYNLIMKKKNYNKHSSTNITKVDYWRRHMTASIVSKYWLMRFLSLEKAILTYAQVLSLEVKCNFIIITNYHYTADVLVRYLSVKFEQKFTINQAVKPLVHFLKKLIRRYKILNGFRIILAGRFTRRQRASRREFRAGNVPLTTLNANIDYAHAYSVLKDGTCGIKIWLNKSNNIIGGDFRLNST